MRKNPEVVPLPDAVVGILLQPSRQFFGFGELMDRETQLRKAPVQFPESPNPIRSAVLDRCDHILIRWQRQIEMRCNPQISTNFVKEDVPDISREVLSALERQREKRPHGRSLIRGWSLRPALAYAAAGAFGIAVGVLIWTVVSPTPAVASDPLSVTYLSEKPPYALVTFYFGEATEEANE